MAIGVMMVDGTTWEVWEPKQVHGVSARAEKALEEGKFVALRQAESWDNIRVNPAHIVAVYDDGVEIPEKPKGETPAHLRRDEE